MSKTLATARRQERVKFKVPRSVQDAIPIRRIWTDGIFQVGNQYSKSWSFTDINYAIADKDDKTAMFLDYCALLNALDSGASAKITIHNRRIDKEDFERSVLLPLRGDSLDHYRKEFNEMLRAQVTGTSNSMVRERYLTISIVKRSIDEARTYFARVGTDLVTHLAKLSSVAAELSTPDRLRLLRDFFKAGQPPAFDFDLHQHAKRGHSFKDWLCPDSMEFAADHFKIDGRFGRVLYLQNYASYIKDSFISELCDLDRSMMLSIDILPVPTDEAARQMQNTLLGVETNIATWQRKQNAANNWSATIPYDMELQRKETKEMLDDLTTRDQRMLLGLVTLVHMADSRQQLDSDTETLQSVGRKHLCQLSTLRWQQKDGLDTVLPYGLRRIQALRTLTTESTAVLIPFRAQEILQSGGIYYGQNTVSKNMIVADRTKLLNGNSFRLGVSGSGKSMSAKEELVQIALATEDGLCNFRYIGAVQKRRKDFLHDGCFRWLDGKTSRRIIPVAVWRHRDAECAVLHPHDGSLHTPAEPLSQLCQALLLQAVCKSLQILQRQSACVHLLVGLRQAMRFIDDQRTVILEQRLPAVLAVGCVCQQVIVVAHLEPDGRVFRHPKVVLVPAVVSAEAIPGTALRHADSAPIIARQPRDLVQVQAGIGLL